MKKRFQLQVENKNPDRVVEAIKHEIRKYIKREKRKTLPEGADFWKFECKFAQNDEEPKEIEFVDITKNIDEAHALKCESFYIELIAGSGFKPKEVKIESTQAPVEVAEEELSAVAKEELS